jgi:hypothetical protein
MSWRFAPDPEGGCQVTPGTRLAVRVAMRLAAAAIAIVLGLATTAAFAEPPGVTPQRMPVPDQPLVESYRLQTAIADGVALVTLAATHDASAGATFGVGTYLLGAPIIHLLHRRPGRALGSLALRAGLPLGAALLLEASHKNSCPSSSTQCDDLSGLGLFVGGIIGGAVVASVLDTALLAKGDDPPARGWGPAVAPNHGGVTLGIAGSF